MLLHKIIDFHCYIILEYLNHFRMIPTPDHKTFYSGKWRAFNCFSEYVVMTSVMEP